MRDAACRPGVRGTGRAAAPSSATATADS